MCGCDLDYQIGKRIRARRLALRLTQAQLAAKVGVRPQQVSRYECGENPTTAVLLWTLSGVLDQPIESFFAGLNRECVS